MKKKLLLIGGVTWKETKHPHIGGTTVLMDNLIDYCELHNINYVVIQTNKYYGRCSSIRNFFNMVKGLLRYSRRGDVAMVNISSSPGIITLLPFIVMFSKLFGLEVVSRKFAGSVHHYLDAKLWRKRIAFWCLKNTKVAFFETEELLNWCKSNYIKAEWFPNVRNSNSYSTKSIYEKKLVFVAQVYEDKGVDILLRLSNRLPNDYTIDIYGPITDARYNNEYFSHYRANYKGLLKPDDVAKTLSMYNVLAFPTWWHSEGYPGVIIEALSVGLPVVSTRIGGIPEMIEEGKSGLLVEVKDEQAFEKAILNINQQSYGRLRKGAEDSFQTYNADLVNPRIINKMLE